MLDEVRASCAEVARAATFVRIRGDAIEGYARSLPLDLLRAPELDPGTHYLRDSEGTLAYLLQLDAINFGSGYFPRLRKRPGLSGYFTVTSTLLTLVLIPAVYTIMDDFSGLVARSPRIVRLLARLPGWRPAKRPQQVRQPERVPVPVGGGAE